MATRRVGREGSKRAGRFATVACLSLVLAGLSIGLVPNATAATPTEISGQLGNVTGVLASWVVRSGNNFSTFADVFQFQGDISGNCTGSDTSIVGLGPGNLSENGTGFIRDTGSCTLVGSVIGVTGSLEIKFISSTGFDCCEDKFMFLFSGDNGTGGLAGAHITNGVFAPPGSGAYTADVHFG